MFVGRERELEELERYYKQDAFQFAVFYGRRRVGKTTLINRFRKDKKSVYFVAVESTAKENLELFSRQIISTLAPEAPQNPFASFAETFEYCFRAAEKRRLVLVIDEYPYLAESDRAVSSVLQAAIDKYQAKSRLFLILCGSSMSFMETQVLGYKSPLYGRRTCQFKIAPFHYYECAKMFGGFTTEEKITLYGVLGGIPEYAARVNNSLSLAKNIEDLFFNPSGRLFEEPSNLLKQELKVPQTYNGIITAIACGASKLNEIATKTGIETSQCSNMLNTLISLGIVKKESPVAENRPRKTIYRLADLMFRFWYRFVLPDLSRISMGFGKTVCAEVLGGAKASGKIEAHTGYVFEELAVQFLWWEMSRGNCNFKSIGRWWGSNPRERREEEIDLLAVNDEGPVIFGECKWKNTRIDTDTLEDLIRKSLLFSQYEKKQYFLFSKSGFTAGLKKTALARGDTVLIEPGDMF
ncbi:ATPase [Spirochaetia bacterium]|nr:ATPase [Spirochaetia bacterium]